MKFESLSPRELNEYIPNRLPHLVYDHPGVVPDISLRCSAVIPKFDYTLSHSFNYFILKKYPWEEEIPENFDPENFVCVFKTGESFVGSSTDAYLFKIENNVSPSLPEGKKLKNLAYYVSDLELCSPESDLNLLHNIFGFSNSDLGSVEHIHGFKKGENRRYLNELQQELAIKSFRHLAYQEDGQLQKDYFNDKNTVLQNWHNCQRLRLVGFDTSGNDKLVNIKGHPLV